MLYLQPPLFTSQSFALCSQTPGLLHLRSPAGVPDSRVTRGRLPEEPVADSLQEPREAAGIRERGKKQEQEWRSQCGSSSDQFCNLTALKQCECETIVYEHYDISAPDEGIPGDDEKSLSSFEVPLEAPARL